MNPIVGFTEPSRLFSVTRGFLSILSFVVVAVLLVSPSFALDVPKDPQKALSLARTEKEKGVRELTKAREGGPGEAKHARTAMKHLENSQVLYAFYFDKVGEDEKIEEEMSELQSLLYWCRKMTPLRDEPSEAEPPAPSEPASDSPAPNPLPRSPLEGPRPGDPIPEPAPPRDRNEVAKELFEDAERFARQFPDLRLQIVASYFRVADTYRDTEWGMKALEKAIEFARGWTDRETGSAPAVEKGSKAPAKPIITDPTLLRLRLRHQDPDVRRVSLDGLVQTLGGEAVGDLHELFLNETDLDVRATVFKHLTTLKDKRTIEAFKSFWSTQDRQVAEDFIRLVAAIGSEKDVRYMLYTVVYNVEDLLCGELRNGLVGDSLQENLEKYIGIVKSAYASGLRYSLTQGIKAMGKRGVKGLTNMFKTYGPATREAILTLGILREWKTGKLMVIYLARSKAGVYRWEAMASLEMMGDRVIPYLIRCLGNSKLKTWSAWLLRHMTGQTYGGSPAKWWAWYRANKR
jgi:hypothetical protein